MFRCINAAVLLAALSLAGCRSVPPAVPVRVQPPPAPATQVRAEDSLSVAAAAGAAHANAVQQRPSSVRRAAALAPIVAPRVIAREFTLTELQRLAVENNPTLRQARQLVEQARGVWLQVGLYPNPVVGYQAEDVGNEDTAGQQGGYVSQTIVTGRKLDWNRAVAAHSVDAAQWQAQAQQMRVLNDVRRQFYVALGAQETVAVAEQLKQIAADGVQTTRDLLKAKRAPEIDVLRTEIDLHAMELLVANSRQIEDAARRQLAAMIGVEVPFGKLSGRFDAGPTSLEHDSLLTHLLAGSPALQVARTQVERARAQLAREQVQPIPNVSVRLGAAEDFAADFTVFSAQVGVMLPLHNRNQGNIVAAAADFHRAVDDVARLELLLKSEFAAAWQRYETARTQATTYEKSILPKAETTLKEVNKAYPAQLSLLDVLRARRTYFENRRRSLAARIELRKALVEIEGLLLTGGLSNPQSATFSPTQDSGGPPNQLIPPSTR